MAGRGLLASLMIKLGLDSSQFKRGINEAEQKTNKFGNFMKKIGGMIAGAFAVQQIISFGKELINLGGIAEGVSSAFNRIADDKILSDLKDATRGTVSELELMKRTVQASNFGLPVEKLAGLFEFATKRAQETGENVDYLVNSIVLGISRKSIPILDNLGISSTQLRDKLGDAGVAGATAFELMTAVNEIAAESMEKSGGVIDTVAIKTQRLRSKWQDLKTTWGEAIATGNALNGVLDWMLRQVNLIPEGLNRSGKALRFVFGLKGDESTTNDAINDLNESIDKFNAKRDKFKQFYEDFKLLFNPTGSVPKSITTVSDRINELNKEILQQQKLITKDAEYTSVIAAIEKVEELRAELDKLKAAFGDVGERELPTDLSMIKPITDIPKIGESDISKIAGSTGLELDKLNKHIEETTDKAAKLQEDYLRQWNDFKEQMAMVAVDFGINVVSELGAAFGELARTGEFPADFGKNILSIIGSFISQLGTMLIGLGVASESFRDLLASGFLLGGIPLIAAGASLVLLGGAISGFAKAGPTGSSSGSSSGFSVSSQPYTLASQTGNRTENLNLSLSGVIQGDSIYLSNKRNTYKRAVIG